uniref:Uncharacterized protein n=1 Tax=Chromera velia CCMP2878 TaxID=1169474 RepID=A0A0G4GY14_9ALVE|eukprot:Cvel_768.t1-p1 / transcript=Cvel_768.t1 / gene=Cvel_768 / organism=Chromera_velia_CCMP2878 / gene_product=hypothetical protein / transcript_product=hypothetical protein / location=Cvel_scaffold24:6307-23576(+) / protein_length=1992 / sequence_SO=supercontig / SO=protein_coding / is_pseudo=false
MALQQRRRDAVKLVDNTAANSILVFAFESRQMEVVQGEDENGSEDTRKFKIIWKSCRFRPSEYAESAVVPGQKLNHFSRSTSITRKDYLIRFVRKMKEQKERDREMAAAMKANAKNNRKKKSAGGKASPPNSTHSHSRGPTPCPSKGDLAGIPSSTRAPAWHSANDKNDGGSAMVHQGSRDLGREKGEKTQGGKGKEKGQAGTYKSGTSSSNLKEKRKSQSTEWRDKDKERLRKGSGRYGIRQRGEREKDGDGFFGLEGPTTERERGVGRETSKETEKAQLKDAHAMSLKLANSHAKTAPVWICKPADLSRGRKIFLFRELCGLKYDQQSIVQQYVQRPMLIAGYKVNCSPALSVSCSVDVDVKANLLLDTIDIVKRTMEIEARHAANKAASAMGQQGGLGSFARSHRTSPPGASLHTSLRAARDRERERERAERGDMSPSRQPLQRDREREISDRLRQRQRERDRERTAGGDANPFSMSPQRRKEKAEHTNFDTGHDGTSVHAPPSSPVSRHFKMETSPKRSPPAAQSKDIGRDTEGARRSDQTDLFSARSTHVKSKKSAEGIQQRSAPQGATQSSSQSQSPPPQRTTRAGFGTVATATAASLRFQASPYLTPSFGTQGRKQQHRQAAWALLQKRNRQEGRQQPAASGPSLLSSARHALASQSDPMDVAAEGGQEGRGRAFMSDGGTGGITWEGVRETAEGEYSGQIDGDDQINNNETNNEKAWNHVEYSERSDRHQSGEGSERESDSEGEEEEDDEEDLEGEGEGEEREDEEVDSSSLQWSAPLALTDTELMSAFTAGAARRGRSGTSSASASGRHHDRDARGHPQSSRGLSSRGRGGEGGGRGGDSRCPSRAGARSSMSLRRSQSGGGVGGVKKKKSLRRLRQKEREKELEREREKAKNSADVIRLQVETKGFKAAVEALKKQTQYGGGLSDGEEAAEDSGEWTEGVSGSGGFLSELQKLRASMPPERRPHRGIEGVGLSDVCAIGQFDVVFPFSESSEALSILMSRFMEAGKGVDAQDCARAIVQELRCIDQHIKRLAAVVSRGEGFAPFDPAVHTLHAGGTSLVCKAPPGAQGRNRRGQALPLPPFCGPHCPQLPVLASQTLFDTSFWQSVCVCIAKNTAWQGVNRCTESGDWGRLGMGESADKDRDGHSPSRHRPLLPSPSPAKPPSFLYANAASCLNPAGGPHQHQNQDTHPPSSFLGLLQSITNRASAASIAVPEPLSAAVSMSTTGTQGPGTGTGSSVVAGSFGALQVPASSSARDRETPPQSAETSWRLAEWTARQQEKLAATTAEKEKENERPAPWSLAAAAEGDNASPSSSSGPPTTSNRDTHSNAAVHEGSLSVPLFESLGKAGAAGKEAGNFVSFAFNPGQDTFPSSPKCNSDSHSRPLHLKGTEREAQRTREEETEETDVPIPLENKTTETVARSRVHLTPPHCSRTQSNEGSTTVPASNRRAETEATAETDDIPTPTNSFTRGTSEKEKTVNTNQSVGLRTNVRLPAASATAAARDLRARRVSSDRLLGLKDSGGNRPPQEPSPLAKRGDEGGSRQSSDNQGRDIFHKSAEGNITTTVSQSKNRHSNAPVGAALQATLDQKDTKANGGRQQASTAVPPPPPSESLHSAGPGAHGRAPAFRSSRLSHPPSAPSLQAWELQNVCTRLGFDVSEVQELMRINAAAAAAAASATTAQPNSSSSSYIAAPGASPSDGVNATGARASGRGEMGNHVVGAGEKNDDEDDDEDDEEERRESDRVAAACERYSRLYLPVSSSLSAPSTTTAAATASKRLFRGRHSVEHGKERGEFVGPSTPQGPRQIPLPWGRSARESDHLPPSYGFYHPQQLRSKMDSSHHPGGMPLQPVEGPGQGENRMRKSRTGTGQLSVSQGQSMPPTPSGGSGKGRLTPRGHVAQIPKETAAAYGAPGFGSVTGQGARARPKAVREWQSGSGERGGEKGTLNQQKQQQQQREGVQRVPRVTPDIRLARVQELPPSAVRGQ